MCTGYGVASMSAGPRACWRAATERSAIDHARQHWGPRICITAQLRAPPSRALLKVEIVELRVDGYGHSAGANVGSTRSLAMLPAPPKSPGAHGSKFISAASVQPFAELMKAPVVRFERS